MQRAHDPTTACVAGHIAGNPGLPRAGRPRQRRAPAAVKTVRVSGLSLYP
jgi:hypothetical protein